VHNTQSIRRPHHWHARAGEPKSVVTHLIS